MKSSLIFTSLFLVAANSTVFCSESHDTAQQNSKFAALKQFAQTELFEEFKQFAQTEFTRYTDATARTEYKKMAKDAVPEIAKGTTAFVVAIVPVFAATSLFGLSRRITSTLLFASAFKVYADLINRDFAVKNVLCLATIKSLATLYHCDKAYDYNEKKTFELRFKKGAIRKLGQELASGVVGYGLGHVAGNIGNSVGSKVAQYLNVETSK